MKSFNVTIKDITAWTTKVRAPDANQAEDIAWELFHTAADRNEYFEDDSDTTVQVEEVES